MRFKPYGVEYRVLSNFWLTNLSRRRAVWDRMQNGIWAMRDEFVPDTPKGILYNDMMIESINESIASGTLASLLSENRPNLQSATGYVETIQTPFADDPAKLDKLLSDYPPAINLIGRVGGIYGDFFNFYLCDLTLTVNGLQPGGPVREVRITKQPTGRCTPQ